MNTKEIDAFKVYYCQAYDDYKNPYVEKSFSEVLVRISGYINEAEKITEERRKINFNSNYKNIPEWQVYGKEAAWAMWEKYHFSSLFSGLERILTIGLFESIKQNDFKILKNSLHSYNRVQWARHLYLATGYDHTGNFFKAIYGLADGDIELVRRQLPESLGLGTKKTSYIPSRVGGSAVMALIYKRDDWKNECQDMLEKFINTKSMGEIYKNIGKYLLLLINQDASSASEHLNRVANKYKSLTVLQNFNQDIFKFFPVFVHGLYNLAYFSLPNNLFMEISKPKNYFLPEFEVINRQLSYNPGLNCFNLTENTKAMEELFCF